jgi:hypothetical protein
MQKNNSGELVSIYTLVDITHTKDNNPKGTTHSFKQEQNFNTILQVLGLRTQIIVESIECIKSQSMSGHGFGSYYSGKNDVWELRVKSETDDIWKNDEDPLYYAIHDCDGIPIYTGLDETTTLLPSIFTIDDIHKNMYFKLGDNYI